MGKIHGVAKVFALMVLLAMLVSGCLGDNDAFWAFLRRRSIALDQILGGRLKILILVLLPDRLEKGRSPYLGTEVLTSA